MNPSYEERMQAARERLSAALNPQTGPEKSIVEWLGKWDEPTITIVADMVERRISAEHQASQIVVADDVSGMDLHQLEGLARHMLTRIDQLIPERNAGGAS